MECIAAFGKAELIQHVRSCWISHLAWALRPVNLVHWRNFTIIRQPRPPPPPLSCCHPAGSCINYLPNNFFERLHHSVHWSLDRSPPLFTVAGATLKSTPLFYKISAWLPIPLQVNPYSLISFSATLLTVLFFRTKHEWWLCYWYYREGEGEWISMQGSQDGEGLGLFVSRAKESRPSHQYVWVLNYFEDQLISCRHFMKGKWTKSLNGTSFLLNGGQPVLCNLSNLFPSSI